MLGTENVIATALNRLGYTRIKKFTYRARWSTAEVEHLLYFRMWGTPKYFMDGDFGIRNTGAENFGFECIRLFGGPLYQILKHDPKIDCTMRFSLGNMLDWKPRWSIDLREMTSESLSTKLARDVGEHLLPRVQHILTIENFLDFLKSDENFNRWFRVNSAIRAAQIVYLAKKIGIDSAKVRIYLKQHEKIIGDYPLDVGTVTC